MVRPENNKAVTYSPEEDVLRLEIRGIDFIGSPGF